jgi:glycine/D-amino acid oxidase-like deaminating enzyme
LAGPILQSPTEASYDVVIVGGAMMGSSVAWWLSREPGFDGSVLVVERDPSYVRSSTVASNSCIRQQFSNELNTRISQFTADFIRTFPEWFEDSDIPSLATRYFGYMYLADTEAFASTLRVNQALQASWGAGTQILSPAEISEAFPFYNVDDIVCGSHNVVDEGYFDGGTIFDTWRTHARKNGVEYCTNEVIGIDLVNNRITGVQLASDETIACGTVVNAAGPRAALVAAMIGIDLPVEPRKRYCFTFDAAEPLDRALPLTIDPTGVHCRSDGGSYLTGCTPDDDRAVEPDDHAIDPDVWEDKIWPALAHRIPAFERIKVVNRWVGHYSFNTLDQNAIVGPHPTVENFVFVNGFSGHGLQQSPAMGRGVAETITHGEYRSIDLRPLGFDRVLAGEPFLERAVI